MNFCSFASTNADAAREPDGLLLAVPNTLASESVSGSTVDATNICIDWCVDESCRSHIDHLARSTFIICLARADDIQSV
jgi:hypothetical protein